MSRLETNDERRFKEIAQNHQDLLGVLFAGWIERFDAGEFTSGGREHDAVTKFRETQGKIDAIRVQGDAERKRRAEAADG
jgi:hypothetical protein